MRECTERITLNLSPLDVVCDIVEIFEHIKELQCMRISNPLKVWLLCACVCIISLSLSHLYRTTKVWVSLSFLALCILQ